MFWLSATLVIGLLPIILLLPFFLWRNSKRSGGGKEAPLAEGAWPIIGHLLLLSGTHTPQKKLGAMADKYGPIFAIKLGSKRVVVVSDWKTAKECLATNDLATSSRPRLVAVEHLSYDQAMFAFAPYGTYWHHVRKIATQELLSNSRNELLRHVRVSEVETSVKALFKLWEENKKGSGSGVVVDMKRWFGELTLNSILRVVVGKRYFGSAAGAVADEEKARRCINALREFFRLMGVFVVGDAVPWLRWADIGGHEKAMKETALELDAILSEWLEEHKRKTGLGEATHGGPQDLMDVMLSALDGAMLAGYDSDTVIKSTILILIGAAVDTTTATLTWVLSRLLNSPDDLRQAQKELDIQVGRERAVKESDIDNLVYIQAIVKETLRLHPPAVFSGPREFTEDCTIHGYYIPKGTRLIPNLWKIQTDPSIWSHPLEFKPERFLTTHKDVDVRGHHFELIPFGSGRRICPGIPFALPMIHLALASFLHSFEISNPSDEPIDMTEIFGLVNMKATPLNVLINPRYGALRC